jgi:hypothetical protein
MLLRELQTYLETHRRASLADLSQTLHVEADAVRGMLTPLIRKGRVCKVEGASCPGCHSCAPETLEFYEWVTASRPN